MQQVKPEGELTSDILKNKTLSPLHLPLLFSQFQNSRHQFTQFSRSLSAGPCGLTGCPLPQSGENLPSRVPGKIPFSNESRAASRKLKTHSGWLRGRGHNWTWRRRWEFGPWITLRHCCLAKLNFSLQIVALTCGDPAGQQHPEADEDPSLGRPCGHLAPDAGRGSSGNTESGWAGCTTPRDPAPRVPSAPPRSSERQKSSTFRSPQEGCLG